VLLLLYEATFEIYPFLFNNKKKGKEREGRERKGKLTRNQRFFPPLLNLVQPRTRKKNSQFTIH
jgi:hypothetical protein